MARPRAGRICPQPGCPQDTPCPTPGHTRTAWDTSNRSARLPKNWQQLRRQVLKRDRHTCQNCGTTQGPLEVDHIDRGDNHKLSNLQTLCKTCHARKTSTEATQARLGR